MQNRFAKRLWHTNRKEFIKEFSILQTINSEGNVEHTYFARNPKTLDLEKLSTCQIEELQCTGLKDKNGKLIYEGDIVKSKFKFVTRTLNPLLFDVGDVVFQNLFGGFAINSCRNAAPFQQAQLGSVEAVNCEVIGNIYENKELLNER